MARDEKKLLEAKCLLYVELIKIDPDEATKAELDLMLALLHDEQIRNVFRKTLGPKKG